MIQLVLIILVFSSLKVCGQHYEAYEVRDDSEHLDRSSSYSHFGKRNASASISARKYQRSTRKTTPPFLPTIATSSLTTPSTTISSTTGKSYRPYESVRSTSITPLSSNSIRKTRRRPHINLRKPSSNTTTVNDRLQPRKRNETRLLNNANIEQIISEASNVVSSHISDNSYLSNTGGLDTSSNYLANSPDSTFLANSAGKGSYFNTHAISEAAAAKVLFSTDLLSPKFNVDQTGFGYFRSASDSHSLIDSDEIPSFKKRKTTTSPASVDFHLDTELAIADLPLQSSYASQNSQHFRRQPPASLYRHHAHSAASHNQIQLYNDDVRAQHETRIIEQLANSPHPADKAKYYQYLKSKGDEKVEKFSIREQSQKPASPPVVVRSKPVHYHKTILLNNNGPPQHLHFVRKPVDRPISLGLSHYKTHLMDRSYSYPFI